MPNISKINGIDEDDISHHNGGTAALYTSKNGDTWVHFVGMAASGGNTHVRDGSTDYKVATFTGDGNFVVSTLGHGEIEYLVIAGGAGGGTGNYSGGGGAGGYRTATGFSLPSASTYAITIGCGGATGPANKHSVNGENTVFDTAGVGTTITSTGGGGCGGYDTGYEAGVAGGSGGGEGGGFGGASATGGAASPAGQGYAGGSCNTTSTSRSAGGGGAAAVGESVTGHQYSSTGGDGGTGALSSITGSAVRRAGGGGGGTYYNLAGVSVGGNLDGSGDAQDPSNQPTAGAANTGGGGGAGSVNGSDAAGAGTSGGSGVVIIRYRFQ